MVTVRLQYLTRLMIAGFCVLSGACIEGDGSGGSALRIRVSSPDPRCTPLASAFPGLFDFVPGRSDRVVVPEPFPGDLTVLDVSSVPPAIPPDAPPLRIPADSDGDGRAERFLFPVLDGVLGVDEGLALVTASAYEEVLFFDPGEARLLAFEVEVPPGYSPSPNSQLPAAGTAALRTGLSTFACVVPEAGAVDSRGDLLADPGVLDPRLYCDPAGAPSFESNYTSGAAVAAGRLFVSTSNLGSGVGGPDPQLLPGAVLVFDFDLEAEPPRVSPHGSVPVIVTSGFNPTHVTALNAYGRSWVLVTHSGALGIEADDPGTPEVESNGVPLSPASIDVIDAERLQRVATIPLGWAAPAFDRLAIDPSGRLAVVGGVTSRHLFAVDLSVLDWIPDDVVEPWVLDGSAGPDAIIFDAARPFVIPGAPGGAPEAACAGWIVGTAFDETGTRLYATDRCDGTLTVIAMDLTGEPAVVPASSFEVVEQFSVASPLRADTLGEIRDLATLRVRPGRPEIDYQGPDVFVTINDPGLLCAIKIAAR
ncbi:hypothetical protein MK489_09195 [Myxococcota bacterium]|nr:hypothetical protein [Myxococcota bacterium]